ncbi:MAG: hypothetical protein E7262_00415 [Lachnospiraceae bacterium]|nr:hypothetical protein [Lachnospiraceae bacterium]
MGAKIKKETRVDKKNLEKKNINDKKISIKEKNSKSDKGKNKNIDMKKNPNKKIITNNKNSNSKMKSKRSVRTIILAVAIVPVVVLGIIVALLFSTTLSRSTDRDVLNNIQGSALTVLTAYNQNPGDYISGADGGLWKGNFNIGGSTELIKSIGEASGIDIFFYSNDACIVSTMEDVAETNMAFPKDIAKAAIEGKYDFSSTNYNVNGVPSYVYGITVFQERSDEDVIGMIVVSADVQSRKASMNNVISITGISVVCLVIASIVLAVIIASRFTSAIKAGVNNIEKVATGELKVNFTNDVLKRQDELGVMNNSLFVLVRELRTMIKKSIEEVDGLQDSAQHLDDTAQKTKESIDTVNKVVGVMTETAEVQYKTSNKVSKNIVVLNEMLNATYEEIVKLNNIKNGMQLEGSNVKNIVEELLYINETLNNVILALNQQIEKTNVSANQIRRFAEQISSFADETELLSINASIEAVRVGEQGKGFGIVANQIKQLADQSALVSKSIADEIKYLLRGSNKTMRNMEEVNEVIGRMNNSIDVTEEIFKNINGGIDVMSGNVEHIKEKIKVMGETSEEIIEVVDELKDAANKNKQTASDTSQVTDCMTDLFYEASEIKKVSQKLSDTMNVFKL